MKGSDERRVMRVSYEGEWWGVSDEWWVMKDEWLGVSDEGWVLCDKRWGFGVLNVSYGGGGARRISQPILRNFGEIQINFANFAQMMEYFLTN